MYGILLIIVLVVTGGAIAFIGDHLGSKVGKKRISLFGLRPKHTSILVTIITGILITSTTLGIMAIVSENVRTALFGMEQLNQEMAETKEQLASASADLSNARQEQQVADEALKKAKGDLKELQAQKEELENKNSVLQEGNEALERAKQELVARFEVLSKANDELLASQTELKSGNEKLQGENKDLEKRNKDLRDGILIMREGEIAFRAGEILNTGIIKGGCSKEEAKTEIQKILEQAQENAFIMLSQRTTSVSLDDVQAWVYQPEYDAAVSTISSSKDDIVVRIVAVSNLLRGEGLRTTLELYHDKEVYKDGELVLEKGLKLAGTADSAEEAILQFLRDVNDTAIKHGMLADPLTGVVGVIDGNQIYSAIQQLEPKTGMALLSAYANGNTNIIGPLRIRLQVGK